MGYKFGGTSLKVSRDEMRWLDPSLFAIAASNVLTLLLAIIYSWPVAEIMWVYWAQSVIIGVTNFFRMITLTEFSTEGVTSNGQPVPETEAGKRGMAFFFLVHYGIFHVVYLGFLSAMFNPFSLPLPEFLLLLLSIGAFGGAHFFSWMHNRNDDFRSRKPNIGTLMFYPYLRIIPMHLTIIFGSFMTFFGLWLFMILKTGADIGMHMVEHALFRREEESLRIRD